MIVSNICVVSLFRKKMTAQQALYHIFSYCFLLWKSRLLSLRWQALLPQAQQTISISFFHCLMSPAFIIKPHLLLFKRLFLPYTKKHPPERATSKQMCSFREMLLHFYVPNLSSLTSSDPVIPYQKQPSHHSAYQRPWSLPFLPCKCSTAAHSHRWDHRFSQN